MLDADAIIDAEQRLIGALVKYPDALDRVDVVLSAEDFGHEAHRTIYRAIETSQANGSVSLLGVAQRLGSEPIADMSPAEYLGRCVAAAGLLFAVSDLVEVVVEASRLRRLRAMAQAVVDDVEHGGIDAAAIAERAEQALFTISERRTAPQFRSMRDAAESALQLAGAAYDRKSGLSGCPTGLAELDKLMGGLQRSDLVVLAGRPAMGKTALATNIALSLAEQGLPVGFFSLEMSDDQLAIRVLAERAQISSSRVLRGRISDAEYGGLHDAAKAVAPLPVTIDQTGGLSIAQLTTRARRMRRLYGIQAVVVDYLQLMSGLSGKGRYDANRVQEITQITMGLKALAKELDAPVIALSQLSREVEKREDKRPRLADLRDSGSIEQDADVVMFVYREEYYLAAAEPAKDSDAHFEWEAKLERARGRAELIIAKHRHGPTGTVDVAFDASLTRFSDLQEAA